MFTLATCCARIASFIFGSENIFANPFMSPPLSSLPDSPAAPAVSPAGFAAPVAAPFASSLLRVSSCSIATFWLCV